jgi:hypothetical protein
MSFINKKEHNSMTKTIKKATAIIISAILVLSLCSCSSSGGAQVSADEANSYLAGFFSDYNAMNTYLKSPDIAISAFSLDGAGLSALLRAYYQSQSVTYAFTLPEENGENTYTSTVTVVSLDSLNLFTMYNIDREVAVMDSVPIDSEFVASSFYSNIQEGTATQVETTVTITLSYTKGDGWSVEPSNDLAFAIFPNIQNT